LSRDGRRLIVASDTVRIFDTASDVQLASVPIGGTPTTVASSIDSTRAYAHSATSAVLAAIDLTTNALQTTTTVIGSTSNGGVAVAPSGRVYVAAYNRLFEYTPALTMIGADGIPMNASPNRPQFTPDGTRAVMINSQPVTGSAALIIDLQNRSISTVAIGGAPLDQLTVDSNNRAWGYSQFTTQMYDIKFNPATATQVTIPGLGGTTVNRLLRATAEVPNARYTMAIFANILSRIDNASGVSGASVVVPTSTGASLAGPNSTSPVGSLTPILPNQVVAPSATAQVIARVTDGGGNPLFNTQVSFFTSTVGASILNPTVLTNIDGLAVTNVIAPSTGGTLTITATSGSFSTSYLYNVTTGGGGGTFSTVQIVNGNGQIINSSQTAPQLLTVKVVDTQGNPLVGTTVNWSLIGDGALANTFSSITDGFGLASNQYTGPEIYAAFAPFKQAQIIATAATGTATFYITTVPTLTQPGGTAQLVPPPSIAQLSPTAGTQLSGKIGETLTGALRFSVVTAAAFTGNQPIPNVGLSIVSSADGTGNGPTAKCLGDPLTDSTGIVTCDIRIGGRPGTSTLTVTVGGIASFEIVLNGLPGDPAKVVAVKGEGQSGAPNTQLPQAFIARVEDEFGNILPGKTATWQVVSGTGTITYQTTLADQRGEVSAVLLLGATPGPVQVRCTFGTVSYTFTATIQLTASTFRKVSGDNQSAVVNVAYAQPLVVELLDQANQPVPGVVVNFSAPAGVTLSTTSAATNAQGQAQVNATAGAQPGTYTVSAVAIGSQVTFTLSVTPLGPTITSVVNAASFSPGLTPCGLAILYGRNIAPNLSGSVVPNSFVGPYPGSLGNVSIVFGQTTSPLISLNNISGQESVAFQVPCELAPGTTTLTLRTGSTSGTFQANVLAIQPGIFETVTGSERRAVVIKSDGSFVTADNRAVRGENATMFLTGLGVTTPALRTNNAGAGQRVAGSLTVGVNNQGVPLVSATAAPGMIGIYQVTFTIPLDTTPGTGRPLGVFMTDSTGALVFSNGTAIDIQ
jgi:uncharacterized protein (TIGR03437 family)